MIFYSFSPKLNGRAAASMQAIDVLPKNRSLNIDEQYGFDVGAPQNDTGVRREVMRDLKHTNALYPAYKMLPAAVEVNPDCIQLI